ncbi:NACHT domain-containing protein [Sarocladium implicatum]|nr:NACHT domain-containing protein [Sarocladium implicatum]
MNGDEEPGTSGGASASVRQGVAHLGSGTVNIRDIVYHNTPQPDLPTQSLQESLRFERMRFREMAIENEHEGTCSWLLRTAQYKRWMSTGNRDSHDAILWVRGPPGSGKSTLMKFAVEHARDNAEHGLILAHFFNARGSESLEHSIQGMYRALLVRLLDGLPRNTVEDLKKSFGGYPTDEWPVPELVRLLKSAVNMVSGYPITFYLDALDECKIEEVRTMLLVLSSLIRQAWLKGNRIRALFASRPYPHITFEDAVSINLNEEPEHLIDIGKYIDDNLHIGDRKRGGLTNIALQLRQKAAGVFMWVVLVVRLLNEDYDGGNIERLVQRLDETPAGLHALFAYTISRYPEDEHAMLSCFRWLLFASSKERRAGPFWWAVQLDLGTSHKGIARKRSDIADDDMERFILGKCKGLVEFKAGRAQFVHESVRGFIFKESVLRKFYGARDKNDFACQSHERLRDLFVLEYIGLCPQIREVVAKKGSQKVDIKDFDGWGERLQPYETPKLPLARYALSRLCRHAEAAQQRGGDQTFFLETLQARLGSCLLVTTTHIALFGAFSDMISVLIWTNCSTLIEQTQLQSARHARDLGCSFGLGENKSHRTILGHVIRSKGRAKVTSALMNLYVRRETRERWLQDILGVMTRKIPPKMHRRMSQVAQNESPCYGPLLDIADVLPDLALFFLLTLAPPDALNAFSSELKDWIKHPSLTVVARIIILYIKNQISIDGETT